MWIPLLYPAADEHLIGASTLYGIPRSKTDARLDLMVAYRDAVADGCDVAPYLCRVDASGHVAEYEKVGDAMTKLTDAERRRVHIRVSYLDQILSAKGLMSGSQDSAIADEIDHVQEILDYLGTYKGTGNALEISEQLEQQKKSPTRSRVVDLLEASLYILKDALAQGKGTKRKKNEPDMKTARALAKKVVSELGDKASGDELVKAVIAETSIDKATAKRIIKDLWPPEPKPDPTPEQLEERKKKKVERELKKLEPYLEDMSQKSRKTVERLIEENIREERPCIPGPQPTESVKIETKKDEDIGKAIQAGKMPTTLPVPGTPYETGASIYIVEDGILYLGEIEGYEPTRAGKLILALRIIDGPLLDLGKLRKFEIDSDAVEYHGYKHPKTAEAEEQIAIRKKWKKEEKKRPITTPAHSVPEGSVISVGGDMATVLQMDTISDKSIRMSLEYQDGTIKDRTFRRTTHVEILDPGTKGAPNKEKALAKFEKAAKAKFQ